MRCPHCGHTIETDSKFCRHCGKRLVKKGTAPKLAQRMVEGKLVSLDRKYVVYAVAYGVWVLINAVLWIAACLSDSHATGARYFFPFGWSDYSCYSGFEFFVYTVALPAVVCVAAYKWDWIKALVKKDVERLNRKRQD